MLAEYWINHTEVASKIDFRKKKKKKKQKEKGEDEQVYKGITDDETNAVLDGENKHDLKSKNVNQM